MGLIVDVSFPDAQNGFLCTLDGKVLISVDGGYNWGNLNIQSGSSFNSLSFISSVSGIVAGNNGITYKRYRNNLEPQAQWMLVPTNTDQNINSTTFQKNINDFYHYFAVGNGGIILRMITTGQTWTKFSVSENNLNQIRFINNTTGLIVGDNGSIYKTTDFGDTWVAKTSGTTSNLKSVNYIDADNVWVCGSDSYLGKSTDGGNTWTQINSGFSTQFNQIYFADNNRGWVVGDAGYLIYTTDGGNTWIKQDVGSDPGTTENLKSISMKFPNNSDKIIFSHLPSTELSAVKDIYAERIAGIEDVTEKRGLTRDEVAAASNTRKFEIKGRHLLNSINEAGSNITLSAKFFANSSSNRFFPIRYQQHNNTIKDYDIVVKYNPIIDITANWLRIETPHARDLFRGKLDLSIAAKLQAFVNSYEGQLNFNSAFIHRFYGDDEIGPELWACTRYFNLLIDKLAGLETNNNYYPQFMHATDFKEFWNGSNLGFHPQFSAPYFKQGTNENNGDVNFSRSFGICDGYAGHKLDAPYSVNEIKSSKYEVDDFDLPQFNDNTYETMKNWHTRTQSTIEKQLVTNYVDKKSMIFSDKPWNAWIWPGSERWYKNTNNSTMSVADGRPKTGEELNLMINYPLFLGSKGLFYWIKNRWDNFETGENLACLGLQANSTMAYLDALPQNITQFDEPSMNLDFIDFTADDNNYLWKKYYNESSYDWDALGVPSTRVYIGLQTLRYELKKKHDWIKAHNNLIMNMKLIAWFGHGHTNIKLGNYNLNFDDNIINKFIDISQIKTRPLDRMENGLPLYEQHETLDSGFYDIMIHQNGTTSLDDEWTLAVVNRRTDPLIFDESNNQFYFISTHEFDNLTLDTVGNQKRNPISNEMKSTDYWREKYWQRQGVREIRIKMKYEKPGTHDKVLLRVQELLAENEPLTNLNGTPGSTPEWWRQERWNNAVKDTVIRSDGELVLKMAPGEGRMFKVTVEETQDIVGELANSNQTKIIAYPAHQTSNQDYSGHDDSVYYLKV